MSATSIYHECSYGDVSRDWDLRPPAITPTVSKACQSSKPWDAELTSTPCTISEALFDELTQSATWNNVTPSQQKHAFAQWQLLASSSCDADSQRRSWQCALLPEGCLVYNKTDKPPLLHIVLSTTPRACVLWRVKEDKDGRIHFMAGADALVVTSVTRPHEWLVAELALSPWKENPTSRSTSLCLKRKPGAHSAMKFNAYRGFERLSLSQLGLLVRDLEMGVSDKKLLKQEPEIVTLLVKHVLGEDVAQATLGRALARRHLVEVPESTPPPLAEQDIEHTTHANDDDADTEN
eukprot:5494429-Amphidinium_carterae.1